MKAVQSIAFPGQDGNSAAIKSGNLDDIISERSRRLVLYQNEAYSRRYLKWVERIRNVESERVPGHAELTEAVARFYFKLLAYKDEYEVARMYSSEEFHEHLKLQFEGNYHLKIHLAPPFWARRDPHSGEPLKSAYGSWMFTAMRILAKFKFLRNTILDPFGRTEERRMERRLISEYENMTEELLRNLNLANHSLAVQLAEIPDQIRGFDRVKWRHAHDASKNREFLLLRFRELSENKIIGSVSHRHAVEV